MINEDVPAAAAGDDLFDDGDADFAESPLAGDYQLSTRRLPG